MCIYSKTVLSLHNNAIFTPIEEFLQHKNEIFVDTNFLINKNPADFLPIFRREI